MALLLVSTLMGSVAHAEPALQVTGFATASYSGNIDRRSAEFGLDQAEIDFCRELGDRGSVRVDLEWVKSGADWVAAVEQGWLAYRPAFATGLTCTAGRFNAPIGFESLDLPDMYQVTHGLLFTYCTPSNLTGAMAAFVLGSGFDVKAYAANDWDLNSENNGSPTYGGRLGWTRAETFSGGLSLLSGMRDPAQSLRNTVLDLDLTYTPAEQLTLGGELNGCQADVAGSDGSWFGVMLMAHWEPLQWCGLTGRYDWLDDGDDLVFGSGLQEQRSSATLAPVVTLGPGMRLYGELRLDMSDADVFTDHEGEAQSSTLSGALSMNYSF
jgi:hypothetical protein